MGRKLFGTGAPVIDAEALQRQSVHRLNHEMDQVFLRHHAGPEAEASACRGQ